MSKLCAYDEPGKLATRKLRYTEVGGIKYQDVSGTSKLLRSSLCLHGVHGVLTHRDGEDGKQGQQDESWAAVLSYEYTMKKMDIGPEMSCPINIINIINIINQT
jgi:hypothetical protein